MRSLKLRAAMVSVALLATFAVGVSTAGAQGLAPQTPPPPTTCQNTTWVHEVSATNTFGDGIEEYVVVRALRDSVSNAYCGDVDVQSTVWLPSGVTHTFHNQLWENANTSPLTDGTANPPSGAQGYSWTGTTVAVPDNGSNYLYGQVYWKDSQGAHDALATADWTVN